jgi:DNA-binding transcriptional LysR family regulator
MLDAHQLNVFLIAAETLNFTETAKHLHMSQPSVSQHIKSIENNFGCDLFIRKGRHLELSDAGSVLVPLARDMIKHSILIEETMESLKGEVYGHLIVGCCTTPGKYILPLVLAQFHEGYPQVRISCNVSNQDQAWQELCEGTTHIVLTNTAQKDCREANLRHFMLDPITLIAPSDHPWAEKGEVTIDDLIDGKFIMREPDAGTYKAVRDALAEFDFDINLLNDFLTLGNSEAIALSVQEGLGVGFVSNLVVERINMGKVTPIRITGVEIYQDIFIGYQKRRPASAAQIAFWKFAENLEIPSIGLHQPAPV